ncbi:cutinase family protein [Candidatus Saccharibacteria bacterium]|nr:cutinase family protein [Candidatus Saccharibacteria bacterium]
MRGKNLTQNQGGRKNKIKVRYLVVAIGLMLCGMVTQPKVQAAGCPDVRIIFARGSGGEQDVSGDYLEFKSTIEEKLKTTSLDYDFVDLEYPAVAVGFANLEAASTTLGAFFSGGESYEFGESVEKGVNKLKEYAGDKKCSKTKYVLGGYSQGAMVLLKTLPFFNPEQVIYVATFGDPKIYLPEGEGIIPAACRGENLSDYRMYVPDCQAYKGILGAYIPYEPDDYAGKMGTWCNGRDILCSSHVSIQDHVTYVTNGLYEDASRVIFDKICQAFGVENNISSPHDTAILIDSTGSMASMIEEYKTEALRLAEETLASGGRVALYDYRDLGDPYEPVRHCDFNDCTLELFREELNTIYANGGGDTPESLLSASFHVMTDLEWKLGSTKSLVVLTDADFLSPDRDGMSFDEVVKMSKKIDPVNFYIITNALYGDAYEELAAATDGRVVTNFDELSLLTDYIMERYDSLPRVEESDYVGELPILTVNKVVPNGDEVKVTFETTGMRTLVILNDAILGATTENEVTIVDLDGEVINTLSLVPLGEDVRGESVKVVLNYSSDVEGEVMLNVVDNDIATTIPKTPNTGRR